MSESPPVPSAPLPPPPTLARLRAMGAALGSLDYVRFDQTLAAARRDIGPHPDLTQSETAHRMRRWLNAWGCRLRYPRDGDETDPFVSGVAHWWADWQPRLPARGRALDRLGDPSLSVLADAYDTLGQLPVSLPGRRRRRVGPTAASKTLHFLRPEAALPWDAQIAGRFAAGRGRDGYLAHLDRSRTWARTIVAEAARNGIPRRQISIDVRRPNSSVAKLIDEYLYQVITRDRTF